MVLVQHLELVRPDQPAITTDQAHDVLLHVASQYPLHHFHGFLVGHTHALDELALLAEPVQRRFNLGPTAMDHHRFMPTSLSSTTSSAKSAYQIRSIIKLWRMPATLTSGSA